MVEGPAFRTIFPGLDLLSGGRLQMGLGPAHRHTVICWARLFDDDLAAIDFSHARVDKPRELLRNGCGLAAVHWAPRAGPAKPATTC